MLQLPAFTSSRGGQVRGRQRAGADLGGGGGGSPALRLIKKQTW